MASGKELHPQFVERVIQIANEVYDHETGAFRLQKVGCYTTICCLYAQGEREITVRQLAETLANHESSLSRIVGALDRQGFVERRSISKAGKQGVSTLITPLFLPSN